MAKADAVIVEATAKFLLQNLVVTVHQNNTDQKNMFHGVCLLGLSLIRFFLDWARVDLSELPKNMFCIDDVRALRSATARC